MFHRRGSRLGYLALSFLLGASLLSGCGGDDEIPVKNVWCGKTENTLRVTETETLFVMFEPANVSNKTVTWRSENPAVATVDENGVVTAVGIGDAKIIATTEDGGREAECKREVLAESPAESVSITTSACASRKMPLGVGEERKLQARVEPQNAEQAVLWTSQNPEVATVDRNTGHVTAVSVGEATLVATAEDGNKVATCTVKVTDMANGTIPSAAMLTPIESATTFTVTLGGFDESADTSQMRLNISPVAGLSFEVEDSFSGGTKTFVVTVLYNGTEAFPDGLAQIDYKLENVPDNYAYSGETQTTSIDIHDGQTRSRPIWVSQDNIAAFNAFARTSDGLKKHYKLTQNVTLTGQNNWTAIGTSSNFFTGSFDGGGFTISGLHIALPSSNNQGLFGAINAGAIVENIGLRDIRVSGNRYVGGVVGFNDATVRNCYAMGSVNGGSSGYIGGVAGENYLRGIVENSYSTGSVNGSGNYVGGVVGNNYNIVRNSYSTSTVRGTNYVGGVVGNNTNSSNANSIVLNSYSTGSVNGNTHVGGVVGNNYLTVQDSYSTGSVSGYERVGGVVGYNSGSGSMVDNNYAMGTVKGSGSFVGGVVGENRGGKVRNSHSTNSVDGQHDVGGVVGFNSGAGSLVDRSYATGIIVGSGHVGGVVGGNVDGTVQNSYATNNVSGNDNVGGVVGQNSGGTVQNSYATSNTKGTSNVVGGVVGGNFDKNAKVLNCYATGSVSGNSFVGGVVGYNDYTSTVQNSYATGDVSSAAAGTGGVVGSNHVGKVQNCVALNSSITRCSGRVIGEATTGGTMSNNYARSSIALSRTPTNSPSSKDGEGISPSTYNYETFWRTTLGWNFGTTWQWGPSNLPILKGVGGTQNPKVK